MRTLVQRSLGGAVQEVDASTGFVRAAFSRTGVSDLDGGHVTAGAFDAVIKSMGPEGSNQVWMLLNHDPSTPIGKPSALYTEGDLCVFERTLSADGFQGDILRLYREGDLSEHSFTAYAPVEKIRKEGGTEYYDEFVMLKDVGPVLFAANPDTPVLTVKSRAALDDGLSYQQITWRVDDAFWAQYRRRADYTSVIETYPDSCVAYLETSGEAEFYRITYSWQDGQVLFADMASWTRVESRQIWVEQVSKAKQAGTIEARVKRLEKIAGTMKTEEGNQLVQRSLAEAAEALSVLKPAPQPRSLTDLIDLL